MTERALARVDVGAIERNAAHLAGLLDGGSVLCVVVKADGYGHGAVECARAALAGGAQWLAVATAAEAAHLRGKGIQGRILVMGALTSEDLLMALAARADVVAWDPRFVDLAAGLAQGPARLHVKLDTGMGRLGTREVDQARAVADAIASNPRLDLAGCMTHFATADEPGDEYFAAQLDAFEPFARGLKETHPDMVVHAANSAATYRERASHFDMVRCGVAVYGLDPFQEDPSARGLEPALTLESWVAAVRRFEPGDSAGYGRRWNAPAATWVATIPMGYGDGWRRGLTNNADVLIGGVRHPLVGTVSMDNVTVDVGPDTDVRIGDQAILIGRQGDERILAEEVAARLDTINYEITCGLTQRVRRVHSPDVTAVEERLAANELVRLVRGALGELGASWIVGGTLRDALLGRELRDVDVSVAGDPEPAARAVARALSGHAFPLNVSFGAWRVMDREQTWVVDVSPLHGETIDDDLAQRDFTVNAMALPLSGGELVDPRGGLGDLDAGILRVLGEHSYESDPLRPLRLARLATELPMAPDPETERLTRKHAHRVPEAAAERIWSELKHVVCADQAIEGLELMGTLGLEAALLPELHALRDVEQSRYHHLDVHGHTMEVLRRLLGLENDLESVFGQRAAPLRAVLDEPLGDELTRGQALRFGALFHDIAKPPTRGVLPDGRVTFLGHDKLGEEMVRDITRRLRTSERFSAFVRGLTRHHLTLGFMVHEQPLSREAVYRYLSRTDPVEVEVTVLSCADRLATRGRKADEAIAAHLELGGEMLGEALRWRVEGPPEPAIRGDELAAELGIEPGPEIGRLLERLREARFTGEAGTRAQAVEFARLLRDNPG